MTVLSLVIFFSCNKNEEKLNVGFNPVTEGDIDASWEGGTYTFEYTLENATESMVEPVCQEEWISGWITGEYGKVTFTVAENPTEEERTAEVRLNYEDQSIEFKVRQEGRTVGGNEHFRIEFSNVGTTSFTAKVTPADMDMEYVVLSSDAASMVGFEDDELLFEDAMGYYRGMADNYGMTLAAAMEQFLVTGVYEDNMSNLESGTEYCVFAIGVSVLGDNAEMQAPIARAYVTTKTVDSVDVYLTINVESKYMGNGKAQADVQILTDNTEIKYFAALLSQEDFDIYGASMPEAAEGYLKYFIVTQTAGGMTLDQLYEYYAYKGTYKHSYTCDAKEYYWMAAFAVDESMNIISKVFYERFQAPGLNSDNKITLEVKDVTAVSALIASTTTNEDPYWVGVTATASLYDWDDEYLMWAFVDYYDIASYLLYGSQQNLLFEDLYPETDYTALAFGFEEGSYTTGLTRAPFRTEKAGSPAECTFEFKITNLKPRKVDVEVIPSDPSVHYYYDLFPADYTIEEVREYYETACESQIASGVVKDASEYWRYTATYMGNDKYTFDITPDTRYWFVAMAVDIDAGKIVNIEGSEPFKSPEPIISEASCELDLSSYYDGDELFEYDPIYSKARGKAFLVVRTEVSGPAEHWYHMIFPWEDDYDTYSDEKIIEDIVTRVVDVETSSWYCSWDTEYVAYAVAMDADGNYGKLFRQRFTLTKDGVSPIDEILRMPAPTVYAPFGGPQF